MTTLEDKLRSKGWIVTDTGCWVWCGTTHNSKGYGEVYYDGRTYLAHRAAYIVWVNANLTQQVLHTCDNPPCINPDHLFEGTNADNVADKIAKGRSIHVAGERHPAAKLTEVKAREILALRGTMQCKRVASMYDVSMHTVYAIWSRKIWKHL